LYHLARQFDGRIYGINFEETPIDLSTTNKKKSSFNEDLYFQTILDNLNCAKDVFKKSFVVQYVNFFPGEWQNSKKYMSRIFEFAYKNDIGLGGPDIVPYKKAQMNNSYPFFNQYKGKLIKVAMAIQGPTRTHTNTKTSKKFTEQEFVDFAVDYLGVDIIFWEIE